MTKKKSNPQSKHLKNQEEAAVLDQPKALSTQSSMDDHEEKLQNLKSLNSLILKETVQKRQQVESLVKAKEGLQAGLTLAGEENVGLMLEKDLLLVFVETQMGFEFDGLVRQRSESESVIGLLKSEMNGVMSDLESERGKLRQVCQERDLLKGEMAKLNREYELLLEEKLEREEDIEAIRRESEVVKINLGEMEIVTENMKREIESIVKEKEEIEGEKKGQILVISELEKEVQKLNEIIRNLGKEGEVVHKKALDLEKIYSQAMEQKRVRENEFDALVAEKKEKENAFQRLREDKYSCETLYRMAQMEIENFRESREKLIQEKNEIEEAKLGKDREAVELHKEVGELRDIISELQESCRNQEEGNNQLLSEISRCRDVNAQVMFERDEAQKALDEERKNIVDLRSRVMEIEKKMEGTVAELACVSSSREKLIEEKGEMENQMRLVCEEKDLLQKNLLEVRQGICDLRAKMEALEFRSERALTMLKNTAAFVRLEKNGEGVLNNEQKLADQMESYAAELEAIKDAFTDKEMAVKDLKQQLECMQNSLARAHKRKSLWTVISSATTIFAAASVAYAAKGR
ncbi:paramyosin [Tripterygium wilfordii]|uniref:Paramyosin n=1 Tax=Tripterygium wilfordii TaxID=458696 RepID=A0A7J7D2J2_TRIWF|nr:meiosis-specific nuclear structural protein 1-like [Tripterygium wilfordii]KAF5740560.1 paramyosin [Tripterygium wilfordii]